MIEKKGDNINVVINNRFYKSRQTAPKVYEMNASIYIWKRNSLLKNNLFNSQTTFYEMPVFRSIDIDSIFDFKIVKFIYEKNYLNNYNLSNKLVFVIGGNGQIGSETINALIECNAKVISLDTKIQN